MLLNVVLNKWSDFFISVAAMRLEIHKLILLPNYRHYAALKGAYGTFRLDGGSESMKEQF